MYATQGNETDETVCGKFFLNKMALSQFHLQLYLLHVGLVGLSHFADIVRALKLHRGESQKCQPHHMVDQVSKTSVCNLTANFTSKPFKNTTNCLKIGYQVLEFHTMLYLCGTQIEFTQFSGSHFPTSSTVQVSSPPLSQALNVDWCKRQVMLLSWWPDVKDK